MQKSTIEYRFGLDFAHQPLSFWRQYKDKYPLLSVFAARYLGICSSSVASERLFSQAKRVIDNERSRLDTEMGEKMVLLNAWYRENDPHNIYSK